MPKRISNRPSDINQVAFVQVQRTVEQSEPERSVRVVVSAPKPSKAEISRVMAEMGRKGGKKGGRRSLETMTPEERRERALQAAKARWGSKKRD
jgi:hypothetical protein